MPAVASRADSIRTYLTGATSDGGAQADPQASLGNYRGSTEVQQLQASAPVQVTGVSITFASAANMEGNGTLNYVSSTTSLKWTPPSGNGVGAEVDVSLGGDFLIEGANDNEFIRVTVTPGGLPTSSKADTIALTAVMNKMFDNVSGSERISGLTDYRCESLKNDNTLSVVDLGVYLGNLGLSPVTVQAGGGIGAANTGTITVDTTSGYPDSGFLSNVSSGEKFYYTSKTGTTFVISDAGHRGLFGTTQANIDDGNSLSYIPGFEIGLEEPDGDNKVQTIVNDQTAPSGITFSQPTDSGSALSAGDLGSGSWYALWIKRFTPANAEANPDVEVYFRTAFGAA